MVTRNSAFLYEPLAARLAEAGARCSQGARVAVAARNTNSGSAAVLPPSALAMLWGCPPELGLHRAVVSSPNGARGEQSHHNRALLAFEMCGVTAEMCLSS